jgi:hypothetical protein
MERMEFLLLLGATALSFSHFAEAGNSEVEEDYYRQSTRNILQFEQGFYRVFTEQQLIGIFQ